MNDDVEKRIKKLEERITKIERIKKLEERITKIERFLIGEFKKINTKINMNASRINENISKININASRIK